MSEEQAVPIAQEKQSDVVSISNENMQAFYDEKLGLNQDPIEGSETAEPIEGELVDDAIPESEPEAKEEKPEKTKKNKSFQGRISEVTAEKNAFKEEAIRERTARKALEARIAVLEKPAEPAPQESVEPPGKPTPDQFKDWGDYVEALSDWKVDRKFEAQKAAKAQEEIENSWNSQLDATRQEIADYDEVIERGGDIKVSDAVKEAIYQSGVGPAVLYELLKDANAAKAFAKMGQIAQIIEIGKISANLTKPTQAAITKPIAQASKAPQPISPIRGTTTTDNKVDANGEFTGTADEYKALRMAGKIK